MIRFFRQLRQSLIMPDNMKKYLIYAIGEILLVVIGILIALQVNNWNQERVEKDLLWGYLQNIRSNIDSDLKEAREFNYIYDQIEGGTPHILKLTAKDRLTVRDYWAINTHFNTILNLGYFSPNKSGFEALKNTGAIAGIQGTHMETLLNTYYDETTIIENELIRDMERRDYALKVHSVTEWGYSFSDILKTTSDTLNFYTYSDKFLAMVKSNLAEGILADAYYNGFDQYYSTIELIGSMIISMLEEQQLYTSEHNMRLVSLLDIDTTNEGIEDVLINGSYPSSLNLLTDSNLGQDGIYTQTQAEYITVHYNENTEWAAAIFTVDSIGIGNYRPSKDFSGFTAIELVLRGSLSEQPIYFSIKDRADPDDGNESRVPITLDPDWTTHTIPLETFNTADLKTLNAVAIFVSTSGEPRTLDLKSIRYIPLNEP